MNKKVNLICDSEFLQESNFFITNYYGRQSIMFHTTESEFASRSLLLTAYDTDYNPLPCLRSKLEGRSHPDVKDYVCGETNSDFFIIADKGSVGFDSIVFILKCHIGDFSSDDSDDVIVKVTMETDESVKECLLEAYDKNDTSISFFFYDNFYSRINKNPAPITELVKKAEETPFLDICKDEGCIPLGIDARGNYRLTYGSKNYEPVCNQEPIQVGTYLFSTADLINSLEIVVIERIAHDPYGTFYAVTKPAFVYPRDRESICSKFPDLYHEHCISHNELNIKELTINAETVPYIPLGNEIGDRVVYQQIMTKCGLAGISGDVFQFMVSGDKGFGYYNADEVFIRIAPNVCLGTLIQVDGRYKILLYRMSNTAKYNGKNYAKFIFVNESEFFDDFSNAARFKSPTYPHENISRIVELLLYRNSISPVVIRPERYQAFSRD